MAKILLVGNDIGTVDLMAASAEGLGYDTVSIYESIDTIETTTNESPDLVILEENMNYLNGFEVAEQLRNDPDIPKELPILMMTKHNIDVRELLQYGINDTILPELDPATLREIFVGLTGE